MPDIIEQGAAKNGKAVLYETKCYSQLVTVVSLGKGTAGTGGRGSYDDFHFVDSGLCKCSSLVGVVWEVWNGLSFDPI